MHTYYKADFKLLFAPYSGVAARLLQFYAAANGDGAFVRPFSWEDMTAMLDVPNRTLRDAHAKLLKDGAIKEVYSKTNAKYAGWVVQYNWNVTEGQSGVFRSRFADCTLGSHEAANCPDFLISPTVYNNLVSLWPGSLFVGTGVQTLLGWCNVMDVVYKDLEKPYRYSYGLIQIREWLKHELSEGKEFSWVDNPGGFLSKNILKKGKRITPQDSPLDPSSVSIHYLLSGGGIPPPNMAVFREGVAVFREEGGGIPPHSTMLDPMPHNVSIAANLAHSDRFQTMNPVADRTDQDRLTVVSDRFTGMTAQELDEFLDVG